MSKNEFRNFFRRNWLILLLIFLVIFILLFFASIKKNNNLEEQKKARLSKKELIVEKKQEIIKNKESRKFKNCNEILKYWKTESWIYEIFIKKINKKINVFCDMKTSSWWWTLILTSREWGWLFDEVKSKNSDTVSLNYNYSILEKADFIKTIDNWKFKYRIDANEIWKNWGVWEAPEEYSFISTSRFNTEVNLVEKYWNWKYNTFGIEKRMPYLCNEKYALLTTSVNCNSKWFWTLVAWTKSFSPAPWIHSTMKNPEVIRYWVK